MNQEYLVLELIHSINGRVKRIRITYKSLGYILCCGAALAILAFLMCSSYLRMSWKVSHYNELRADFDRLRSRYQELQRVSRQDNEQMASLESLASEVTVAYGIKAQSHSPTMSVTNSDPSVASNIEESIEQYNFLKAASFGDIYHRYSFRWQSHTQPSLWPVNGILRSSFGGRSDPFSGEGAFHTGIDLAAPSGSPVHATADGVVASAGWSGDYGKLIVIDHGNALETYYAHLSQVLVIPGQEVRRGETIGLSGGTGRATGSHLHYEVRLRGTPVNPYKYLHSQVAQSRTPVHNDLGL